MEEAIASPWIKRFAPGGPDGSPAPATFATVAPSPRNVSASPSKTAAATTPSTVASSSSASLAATAAAAAGTAAAAAGTVTTDTPGDAARLGDAAGAPPANGAAAGSGGAGAGGGEEKISQQAQEAGEVTQLGGAGGGSDLEELPQEVPIQVRLLSSMRDYRSYGALRRTALMVVAYNQSPDKLRELRNEFVDFDTVSLVETTPTLQAVNLFRLVLDFILFLLLS